jgi:hypothetical protein
MDRLDKPLILECECGVETLSVSVLIEPDGDREGYLTFSAWWNQHRRWSERLRVCWTVLRGKSHYFSAVELDRTNLGRLQTYLAWHIPESSHIDITFTDFKGEEQRVYGSYSPTPLEDFITKISQLETKEAAG